MIVLLFKFIPLGYH